MSRLADLFPESLTKEIVRKYVISHAQFEEDVLLFRMLYHIKDKGFYVDVGSADPEYLSVTKFFYDLGWHGINIDPRQSAIDLCKAAGPRDINICVAVSDKRDTLPFWEAGEISTFDRKSAEKIGLSHFKATTAKVVPLDDILLAHAGEKPIHFLKIDAELHEKHVLSGINLRKFRPWVIVVESTDPVTTESNYAEWEDILLKADYRLFTSHRINRFYASA